MQTHWCQATGRITCLAEVMESGQDRAVSKTASRDKEMKEQLQIRGSDDTSHKHNPGQTKEHHATASRPGKFFLVVSGTSSSVSEGDGGRIASHPSLSIQEVGSK